MELWFRKSSIKYVFKDGHQSSHLGFLIRTILTIFDLQVTLMLPTMFQVNWPFGSGEEVKNRFSRWPTWWPSWISDPNDFRYFRSTSHPNASYRVSSQFAFRFRRRRERDFQDGHHLGFPIGMILVIFDLQVTQMLPTKFWVNWPRGVCGVGFYSKLLTPHEGQRMTHAGRQTTDIERSQ